MGNTDTQPEHEQDEKGLRFKIVTIGDSGVGKTSLYLRYTDNRMTEIKTTLNIDFRTKQVEVDGHGIELCLWDTFGQERFRALPKSYYRGSHGLLVVFDLTKKDSLQNIHQWIDECDELSEDKGVTKLLVGNKADLEKKREVSCDTAKKVSDELGIAYIETSALTDTNVSDVFVTIATTLKQRVDDGTLQNAEPKRIHLHEPDAHAIGWICGGC